MLPSVICIVLAMKSFYPDKTAAVLIAMLRNTCAM